MTTRSVALNEQSDEVVGELLASGRYRDAGKAVDAGLLQKDEAEWQTFLARINEGYDQAVRGEFAEGTLEEIMDRVQRRARGK